MNTAQADCPDRAYHGNPFRYCGTCDWSETPEPTAGPAQRVHDLSEWTDGTTEQMRQETGHDCITCPTSVRNLTATAHNALSQWDANQGDLPNWERMHRKMEALRGALARLQPIIDEHFEALNGWRRP